MPQEFLASLDPEQLRHFVERFWSKIDKNGECWLWTARKFADGYGQFKVNHAIGNRRAHRIAYLLEVGHIEPGALICHICDTPACCRPDHLFQGSPSHNSQDMVVKGRQCRGERHPKHTRPEQTLRGERHGMAKLTNADVYFIRAQHKKMTTIALAARFGVSNPVISAIQRRKNWTHI